MGLAGALALAGCAAGTGGGSAVAARQRPPARPPRCSGGRARSRCRHGRRQSTGDVTAKALAADGRCSGLHHRGLGPGQGVPHRGRRHDRQGGQPITDQNHMYIGSVTRTATAAAILQLVDGQNPPRRHGCGRSARRCQTVPGHRDSDGTPAAGHVLGPAGLRQRGKGRHPADIPEGSAAELHVSPADQGGPDANPVAKQGTTAKQHQLHHPRPR